MDTKTQGTLPLQEAKSKFSLFHKVRKMGKKNVMTGLLIFMGLWLVGACLFTVMANSNNRAVMIDREVATIRGEIIQLETEILGKKELYAQAMLQKAEAEKKVAEALQAMQQQAELAESLRVTITEKEHAIDALIEEKAMLNLGFKKPQ